LSRGPFQFQIEDAGLELLPATPRETGPPPPREVPIGLVPRLRPKPVFLLPPRVIPLSVDDRLGPEVAEGTRRRVGAVAFLPQRRGRAAPRASAAVTRTREYCASMGAAHRRPIVEPSVGGARARRAFMLTVLP